MKKTKEEKEEEQEEKIIISDESEPVSYQPEQNFSPGFLYLSYFK